MPSLSNTAKTDCGSSTQALLHSRLQSVLQTLSDVGLADLFVERPQIDELDDQQWQAEEEAQESAAADDQQHHDQFGESAADLADVESMHAEPAGPRQQQPRDAVVHFAGLVFPDAALIHRWNQKQIDEPSNAQQAQRKEPDSSRDGTSVIEAVRSREAEQPDHIAEDQAVRRFRFET